MTSPVPPGEDPAAPGEPQRSALSAPGRLPPEVVAEIRNALVEARVTAEQRAAYGPLRDLADALKSNAEALRAVQETQERIARTVDRTDRTEAVLQSTQALNDTFRGVRATQEALVDRLKQEEKRPLRFGLAAGLLVAATAAVAGFLFLRREDDLRGRIEGLRADMGTADREAWEKSRRSAEKELLDRVEALSKESTLSGADRAAREKDLLKLRDDLEAVRREGDALAVRRGQMELELARLRAENSSLRAEAESQRRVAEDSARALAAAEARAVTAPAPTSSPAPVLDPVPVPPAPAPPPTPAAPPPPSLGPGAVTDAGQVKKVVDALNALLAGVGGADRYRVTSAGAVDGDRLVQVAMESVGTDGAVRRSFECAEARFVLLAASRSLEIRLRGGTVTYLGHRTVRFLDDRHTAYLEVDPAPFKASGHPLVAIQ